MRKDLIIVILGFLAGAAALAGGEEDDGALDEELETLQNTILRLRMQMPKKARRPAGGPGAALELYPIYDLTAPIQSHLPPDHTYPWNADSDISPFARTSRGMLPTGTVEELAERIRSTVWPRTWEERAALNVSGQTLFVMNSQVVLKDIHKELEQIRDTVHRCVAVEFQVVDLPHALYRGMRGAGSTGLDADRVKALEAALADGSADRVFHARGTGYVGQQFYAWHGSQVALLSGAAVRAAKGKTVVDPLVGVRQIGGYVAARPSLGDDPNKITLDLDARFDQLRGAVRTRKTGKAGALDFADVRDASVRSTVVVNNRTWALVGAGTGGGEMTRALLVRATVLTRKGGVK